VLRQFGEWRQMFRRRLAAGLAEVLDKIGGGLVSGHKGMGAAFRYFYINQMIRINSIILGKTSQETGKATNEIELFFVNSAQVRAYPVRCILGL
jgi:hypothetical protein